MSAVLERQYESSPIHGSNAPYVEAIYESYLHDPGSVSEEWRRYFAGFGDTQRDVPHRPIIRAVRERPQQSLADAAGIGWEGSPPSEQASEKQAAVSRLIQVYSLRGHQIADLDPLGLWKRSTPAVPEAGFSRDRRSRPGRRVLHWRACRLRARADEAQGHPGSAGTSLLRPDSN